MVNKKLIKMFVKERDAALKSEDVMIFRKFYQKWLYMGIYEMPLPADDYVIEITIRKCLYHAASATAEEKQRAEEWLKAHGCEVDF